VFTELVLAALLLLVAPWQSYVAGQCTHIVEDRMPPGVPRGAYATAALDGEIGTCTLAPGDAQRLSAPDLALTLVHEAAHVHHMRDERALGVLRSGILAELIADRVTAAAAAQHGWVYVRRSVAQVSDAPAAAGSRGITVRVRE
jgi:hypothetical protein